MHLICQSLKSKCWLSAQLLCFGVWVCFKKPVKMLVWRFPAQCFLGVLCFFQGLGECSSCFPGHFPRSCTSQSGFSHWCVALFCLSDQSPLTRAYLAGKEVLWAYSFPPFSRFHMRLFFSFASFKIEFLFALVLLPTASNSYFCSHRPSLEKLRIASLLQEEHLIKGIFSNLSLSDRYSSQNSFFKILLVVIKCFFPF